VGKSPKGKEGRKTFRRNWSGRSRLVEKQGEINILSSRKGKKEKEEESGGKKLETSFRRGGGEVSRRQCVREKGQGELDD